uniref:Ig-like domain-containing protein n=1 Tax=Syphacia muris TaxID=451379 RepID=A0A0N5A8S2_9BILA
MPYAEQIRMFMLSKYRKVMQFFEVEVDTVITSKFLKERSEYDVSSRTASLLRLLGKQWLGESLGIKADGLAVVCQGSDPKLFWCETPGRASDNVNVTFMKLENGLFKDIAPPTDESHFRKIMTYSNQMVRGTLAIDGITKNDAGYYHCKVENGNREGTGHLQVTVIDCPEEVLITIKGLSPTAFVRYRLVDLPIWHTFVFSRQQKQINGVKGVLTCSIHKTGDERSIVSNSVDVTFSDRMPSKNVTCELPYKGRNFELTVNYEFL